MIVQRQSPCADHLRKQPRSFAAIQGQAADLVNLDSTNHQVMYSLCSHRASTHQRSPRRLGRSQPLDPAGSRTPVVQRQLLLYERGKAANQAYIKTMVDGYKDNRSPHGDRACDECGTVITGTAAERESSSIYLEVGNNQLHFTISMHVFRTHPEHNRKLGRRRGAGRSLHVDLQTTWSAYASHKRSETHRKTVF